MNKEKVIIVVAVSVAVVLLAVGLIVGLSLYNKTPRITAIEGATNVVIDKKSHMVSCDVSAETSTFDMSGFKFNGDSNVEYVVFADKELSKPLDEMELEGGSNIFYVQVTK